MCVLTEEIKNEMSRSEEESTQDSPASPASDANHNLKLGKENVNQAYLSVKQEDTTSNLVDIENNISGRPMQDASLSGSRRFVPSDVANLAHDQFAIDRGFSRDVIQRLKYLKFAHSFLICFQYWLQSFDASPPTDAEICRRPTCAR